MDFSLEIENLKAYRERYPLDMLIQRRDAFVKVADGLKRIILNLRGENCISKLELTENGRPHRGDRTKQIREICQKVGSDSEKFRTRKVLNELREIEGGITTGVRSYTYTVMRKLEKEDILESVGRGTWKLL